MKTTHLAQTLLTTALLACLSTLGSRAQTLIGSADGITRSATEGVVTAAGTNYQSVMARTEPGRAAKFAASLGNLPAYDKNYKPSKKALQADEQTATTETPEGFSKSVSAIHAAYEHLDPKLYPYQPYYDFRDYYAMHTRSSMSQLQHDFDQLLSQSFLAAGTDNMVQILSLRRVSVPKQREGRNFFDETVRNAYCAQFVADPLSRQAFENFVCALMLDDKRVCPLEFPMDDEANAIISRDDNFVLAFNSYEAFLKMRADRRDQALAVARSATPINLVRNAITDWLQQLPEVETAYERFKLYWLANEAYEEVLTQHERYVAGEDANNDVGIALNDCRDMYASILAEGQIERMESHPMPTTFTVKGINLEKVKTLAAESLSETAEVQEVVCLDNSWTTTKTTRTIHVGFLTEVGRFKFLFVRQLAETMKNRKWSGEYTLSGDDAPIKIE